MDLVNINDILLDQDAVLKAVRADKQLMEALGLKSGHLREVKLVEGDDDHERRGKRIDEALNGEPIYDADKIRRVDRALDSLGYDPEKVRRVDEALNLL